MIDRGQASREEEQLRETAEIVTLAVFERAMKERDIYLAFIQVQHSQEHSLDHYAGMRDRLLVLIEKELAKPLAELAEQYRGVLICAKKQLENGFLDTENRMLPKMEMPSAVLDADRVVSEDNIFGLPGESLLGLFHGALDRAEVEAAFKYLKHAFLSESPEYSSMRGRFLSVLESELAKDDQQLGVEYRQRLAEVHKCLVEECWVAGTSAGQQN